MLQAVVCERFPGQAGGGAAPDKRSRSGVCRLCLIHKNVPAMLASITTLLSRDGINVENLSNKSRGDYAYTIVDLSAPADQCVIDEVTALENVIRVRVIQ